MEKKDIYEHLAKIYLDSPTVKKKKKKNSSLIERQIFIIIGVIVVSLFFILISVRTYFSKPLIIQLSLVLTHEPLKINFNFNPVKKEILSFDLNNANLSRFNRLEFSCKKSRAQDTVSLRVEIENSFNEKAEIYLKDIHHRWQKVSLKLTDFKTVTDWSGIKQLNFVVEEWNAQGKDGVVLIDNVRFVR
ncbi:MAG: hypothetical protein N2606_02465 [Candidatus Omnitrophica bacterium]|nr:hypothetical protein [Candidatus Omnitrophota bacterium]